MHCFVLLSHERTSGLSGYESVPLRLSLIGGEFICCNTFFFVGVISLVSVPVKDSNGRFE